MEDNPKTLPERKRNRMDGYDYSLCGAYFVTICLKNRECFLWKTVGADIIRPNNAYELSEYGRIVDTAIKNISDKYPDVVVDEYVIMPDHVHLIICLHDKSDKINGRIISAPTLSVVVGQMKRWVSKQIGFPIWQKSFHDHIIRNEQDYNAIRRYIYENPEKYLYNEHSS